MGQFNPDFTSEVVSVLHRDGVHPVVERLAQCFKVSQISEAAWVCQRLLEISNAAPWMLKILSRGQGPDALSDSLRFVAEKRGKPDFRPRLHGKTDAFPELATLARPRNGTGSTPCIEVMRAVYVCALLRNDPVAHESNAPTGTHPSSETLALSRPTPIVVFGSSIRAIDRGLQSDAKRALRAEYQKAEHCTPGELARKLFSSNEESFTAAGEQTVAHDWSRYWRPLLLDLESELTGTESPARDRRRKRPPSPETPPREITPLQGEPNPERPRRKARDERLSVKRPTVVTLQVTGMDQGFPSEDPFESFSAVQVLGPMTGVEVPKGVSEQEEVARIARSNSLSSIELLPTHIGTMQPEELALIVPGLDAGMRTSVHTDFERKRNATAAHLIATLGCKAEYLGSISFGESVSQPWINLQKGLIHLPVPPPKHCRTIAAEHQHKFDQNASALSRNLTPACIEALRALHQYLPARTVGEWFGTDSIADCAEEALQDLDIEDFSKSLSRLRRAPIAGYLAHCEDIVETQIAFGDDFHHGATGSYYYSPRSDLLERRLAGAESLTIEREDSKPSNLVRVGSANILRKDVARQGISERCNALNRKTSAAEASNPITAARIHNDFVSYVMLAIAIISSHRPHGALFTLARWAFDLIAHYMIAEDKKTDAAHLTRICATTRNLSKTIENYLLHLMALAEQHWATPEFKRTVDNIVKGEAPLLAFMEIEEPSDAPVPTLRAATFKDWLSTWPKIWSGVPSNWYRAFCSTHLRELGVEPCAVSAHMGHLQASGFPYSPDGIVSPEKMLDGVRTGLDKVEVMLGMKARRGFAKLYKGRLPEPELIDWTPVVRAHEKDGHALNKRARQVAQSTVRGCREKADKWLKENLFDVNPMLGQLVSFVNSKAIEADFPTNTEICITEAQIDEVLDALDADLGSDPPSLIATHNALSRAVRRAKRVLPVKCPNIGEYRVGAGTELSPFLKNQGMATTQMHDLRRHFLSHEANTVLMTAVVRRALSMITLGGHCDATQICRFVVAPAEAMRVIREDSLVVIEWEEARLSLTDACATTFLHTMGAELPSEITEHELSELLTAHVPAHMRKAPPGTLLRHLCDLANLSNRFEMSGIGRQQFGRHASLDASAEEQRAFIANRLPELRAGKVAIQPESVAIEVPKAPTWNGAPEADAVRLEKERYERLLNCISYGTPSAPPVGSLERDLRISNRARAAAIEALQPCADHRGGIVDALMLWAKDMALEGTARTTDPERSTHLTYVTAIGMPLILRFGGRPIADIDEDEFLDAYLGICRKDNKKNTKCRAFEQCKQFHSVLIEEFGVEPVSWHETEFLDEGGRDNRHSELISDQEVHLALQWLITQSNDADGPESWNHAAWRRACRTTAVALILLRRSGGRLREISWLRLQDILSVHSWFCVMFRPFRYRGLKSFAARRLIDLSQKLRPDERKLIQEWVSAEKLRQEGMPEGKQFLFGDVEMGTAPFGAARLRAMIKLAFKQATGREVWPHLLRHSAVNENVLALEALIACPGARCFDLMRSAQRVTCEIGHSAFRTQNHHYSHTSWAFRRPSSMQANRYLDRWAISRVSNEAVANVDKGRQLHKSEWSQAHPDARQWLHCVNRRHTKHLDPADCRLKANPARPPSPPQAPLTTVALDHLLSVAGSEQELHFLGPNFGLSLEACEALWLELQRTGTTVCYRLVEGPTRIGTLAVNPRPRRASNWNCSDILSRCTPELTSRLGSHFRRLYGPYEARHDRFRGCMSDIERLKSDLLLVGMSTEIVAPAKSPYVLLKVPSEAATSNFHRVCRAMAICSVWSGVESRVQGHIGKRATLVTVTGPQRTRFAPA